MILGIIVDNAFIFNCAACTDGNVEPEEINEVEIPQQA